MLRAGGTITEEDCYNGSEWYTCSILSFRGADIAYALRSGWKLLPDWRAQLTYHVFRATYEFRYV